MGLRPTSRPHRTRHYPPSTLHTVCLHTPCADPGAHAPRAHSHFLHVVPVSYLPSHRTAAHLPDTHLALAFLPHRPASATVVLYLPHTLPSLAQVTITGAVPTSWGGAPVAQLQPPALAFGPDSFSQPQLLRLHPLGSAGVGPYFVQLTMRCAGMAPCMHYP